MHYLYILSLSKNTSEPISFLENIAFRVPHAQLTQPVSETYMNSDYHKCYALQHLQYQFFGIFVAAVPNHSMRYEFLARLWVMLINTVANNTDLFLLLLGILLIGPYRVF